MLPIIPPVNAQSSKEAIANLHAALLFLRNQVNDTEIRNKEYNDSTRKAVITIQRQFRLNETDGFVGEQTAIHLNKLLKESGAFENEPATENNKLTGKVITVRGVPLKNAKVIIYSTGLEADKILGETVTGAEGNYSFSYPADSSRNLKHDLQVRVIEAGAAVQELGRSAVKYNAGVEETLDVIISDLTPEKEHEHQRLLNDIKPHLGRISMKDITESAERGQISHLANKSAWDARMVAMAVESEKWSAETNIPSSHFYALFRAGLPNDKEALSRLSSTTLQNVLKKAVEEKVIADDGRIGETAKAFDNYGINFLLDNVSTGGASTLGSMLSIRLNDDQKKLFVQSAKQSSGDTNKFWTILKEKGIEENTIKSLQLDGKLGYLTVHNAPLVKRIYDTHRIADPADLASNGFYKPDKWNSIIENDVPQGIDKNEYAKHMATLVNISYPTAVVAEMMNNDEIKTAADLPKQEMYQFLNNNQQKFTIGLQPVKKWEGFGALSEKSKEGVKTIERLYQLTPSNDAMEALSKTGLTSALQITRYSKGEFMMKYGETFSSTKEAELTYNKASEVQSAVMNLATTYLTYRAAPNIYGITGKLKKEENEIIAYPTLEELFGNMDYCACDHCKSVLSPAAYLVDLLQFIDLDDVPHDKDNPIEVLLKRRPDIQHLQLTCENTNTILPYIDIVNEILEYYVINGNLDLFKGHDITASTTTAELLADPQFVMTAAYDEVKTKVYPYDLPFDYPLEALRLLFNAWDVSLPGSLQIFRDATSAGKDLINLNTEEYKILTDTAIHSLPEYFGEPAAATIDQLNTAISNGKIFSRRVNISYEEVVSLLKTAFINPGIVLVPLLEKTTIPLATLQSFYDGTTTDADIDALLPADIIVADYGGDVKQWLRDNQQLIMGLVTLTDAGPKTSECNFADVQLRFALPDNANNRLNELAYHKLHRFIRLWKKTGWSIETTDHATITLMPLAAADLTIANIDTTFITLLARLANLKRIMDLLSLSNKKIQSILVLWDDEKDPAYKLEQCAKLLKMRVQDINDLSTITGIDPLADDMEQDEPSLLQFITVVKALKQASLKIIDLNYLLRNKDEANKLAPADKILLKNIKAIRDVLNAIEKEHGIAPDNADFAFAKSKMALVYDAAVVNDFFGLISDSKTYTAPFITTEEGLPVKITVVDSRVSYDPFKKLLGYNGIILTAAKNALAAAADALVLADMAVITTQPLLDAFKLDLKAKLDALALSGNDDLISFGNNYPELKIVYDAVKAQADPAAQTTALLAGILPELKSRMKGNSLKQTLAAIVKAEPDLISTLTAKKETLQSAGDNTKAIVYDFLQLEQSISFNTNQTYSLYLDAPATDDYIIYVRAPQNTVVTVTIGGVIIINAVTIDASGEVKNSVPLNLKAGELHETELIISALPAGSSAELLWRTKGMAKAVISAGNIYIRQNVDHAKTSLIRLQKAVMLNRLFKFTAVESEYFAAGNTETKNFLNELDTDGTIADVDLHNLWNKLFLLVFFTGVKSETEQEENDWVRVLEDPEVKNLQGNSLLLDMNYWKKADLDSVLTHFAFVITDLSQLSKLKKVMAAMYMVVTIDYPAADVISWSVATPTLLLINDIKQKIKDKTDDAAWLETMQTISDTLRNKQRDALVSYVLYHKRPSPEINTADKLYEYFLIDVQMDACMKTSRIKQAISTVQLFIHRSLMNLEPDIAPASIRAEQWQWMQRYRVWEANRKVFLYPENWLEPELRDNKSSFFKELEGELLQSDINDELAELSFLNYLKKLDDIARLEIVGMYVEEREKGNQFDDILHVFGRTNGATRQYYYRRYEYGYWTPWEKVTLNIEGEHLFPVIWKKRLFVFWLSIVEKAEQVDKSKDLVEISKDTWGNHSKISASISMCWGEYYKGKWTSPKSTEPQQPIVIGNHSVFEPYKILLFVRKEKNPPLSERLIFSLSYNGPAANNNKKFTITYTSKNAPPVIEEQTDAALDKIIEFNSILFRRAYQSSPSATLLNTNSLIVPRTKEFRVTIKQPYNASQEYLTEKLLTKTNKLFNGFKISPLRHGVENQWEGPIFYDDEQCTFFIKPDEDLTVPLWRYDSYYDLGIYEKFIPELEIPPLVEKPVSKWPPKGMIFDKEDMVSNPWEVNESFVNKNENYKNVMVSNKIFIVGNTRFGVGGKIGSEEFNI
ncbi:MAG: hypothetical protein H7122_02230 [Chitinophagaceae bacterium]|nr:hypothetical protein [Chitinophagaceae bacterium]